MDFLQSIKSGHISWHHSDTPLTKDQQQKLSDNFGLLEHHVESTEKGKTPKPSFIATQKYSYFVFHIPYIPKNQNRVVVSELNVYLTSKTLITIQSKGKLSSISDYFQTVSKSTNSIDSRLKMGPGNLLLNTLKHILGEVESCIDAQGDTVEELQSKVFASTKHQHFIQKSSLLRYNQVTLISTLDKQTHVLESIPYDKNPFIGSNDKITHKWQSVLQTFQTFSYELSQDKQYLESLISTFETLVTHTTNQRINQLTVISVMLMPLTLITSLFGMNFLYMPLVVVPSGFWVVVLLMLISLLSSWLIFKLKKWV